MLDMEKVRKLVALKAHKKLCEDQAKRLGEILEPLEDEVMQMMEQEELQNLSIGTTDDELAALEAEVVAMFQRNGVDRVRLGNKVTVYLRTLYWAKALDGDYERACSALRAAGLDDMVEERFNTQTLSAWVRELLDAGEELPPSFDGAIEVNPKTNVMTRKG